MLPQSTGRYTVSMRKPITWVFACALWAGVFPSLAAEWTPGQDHTIEHAGVFGHIVVFLPADYTPQASWPTIVYYHGWGGRPNTRIFRAVTEEKGFVIVGINYGDDKYSKNLDYRRLRGERRHFDRTLDLLEKEISIDRSRVYMAGYSQGGYSAANLGETMLSELSGLVILGAGRGWGSGQSPRQRLIAGKPVFIGAGENDNPHGTRAQLAAMDYHRWGAEITLELWPDTDHLEGWRWYQDDPARGAGLRKWLEHHSRPSTEN